jgi:SAM-dependent methyltransferase
MLSSLRIGFLTSLGVNVGDEFIREGIRAVLDGLDCEYEPLYVNKVDSSSLFDPKEDELSLVSDKYWEADLFIQAGAPVYWRLSEGRATSLTSAWHSWMWQQRILKPAHDSHPFFLNLGAGSCQPWGTGGEDFLADSECAAFAVSAAKRALLTTVRDPVASTILSQLGIPHLALPCPAFLASARNPRKPAKNGPLGINLMPLGAHYDLTGTFDKQKWIEDCHELVHLLRRMKPLLFICHDLSEVEFVRPLAGPGERIFFSQSWRDFLDVFPACSAVVANRIHGAVCAAGYGVPSVILGNDTRAQIGEYIGIQCFQSGQTPPKLVANRVSELLASKDEEQSRLLRLRQLSMESHQKALRPILEGRMAAQSLKLPYRTLLGCAVRCSLASLAQLQNPSFVGFMQSLNAFAARCQLQIHTNWSKVWEYPWLWFNGLSRLCWPDIRLLDVGSELSPFPWFLASLGARVTLVETNPQWLHVWEELRQKLVVDVDWSISENEELPFPRDSYDIVTSLSVIEHQSNKSRAISEIARILKPGGIFALSYDICEPDMGMTFPEWNGKALTTREFEELVWDHLAFDNGGKRPLWNFEDCADFIRWHLESAAYHNYTVGAAVLQKKL